tara:strand:+ start:3288 stop:5564 length:2277 start_codon:yes stop_codon:yes gene_type:complete
MSSAYKYMAFITYAHKDEERATWMRRKLENFRIPRNLIGKEGLYGPIPNRLYPIFRDRDELAGAAQLGPLIEQALQESSHLIVLCSPHAVRSRWVNEEIRLFKAMGKADRVLCIVLDGEPMAEDTNGDPEEECLPLAARRKVDDQGNILHEIFEPGAADLRSSGDGEKDAILKIIAGLLGVGLDEIKQRDILARQRRLVRITSTAVLLAISAVGMATYAFYQRNEAAKAKSDAIAERQSAEDELAKTKTITNFVQNLFESLDPQNTAGMDTELLKTMLDQGALKAQELIDEPVIEARIRVTLGKTYRSIGSYEKAQTELERALNLEIENEDSFTRLQAMNEIAMVHEALGNYVEAEPLLEKLLSQRINELGQEHDHVLDIRIDLAKVYRRIGKLEIAENDCSQILSLLNDQNRSEDDSLLLKCMTELSEIYLANDKVSQAESLSRNVFERSRLYLGENNPFSLERGQVLVESLTQADKLKEAYDLGVNLLQKLTEVLGTNHPDTLKAKDSLAEILAANNNFEKALEYYQEIRENKEEVLGPMHPETLATMKAMAELYLQQDQISESENIQYSVYLRLKEKYGQSHPETLRSMNELADIYLEQARYERSMQLSEGALEIEQVELGEDDPMTLNTMFRIGKLHYISEEEEKAMEILGQTLAMQEKLLGFDNAEATRTRDLLNKILSEQATTIIQLEEEQNSSQPSFQGPPLPDFLGSPEDNATSSSTPSSPRINQYIQAPPVITSPTTELDSINPSGKEK